MSYARVNYKTAREKKLVKYYQEKKKLFVYSTIATEEDKEFFRYCRELMKDLFK